MLTKATTNLRLTERARKRIAESLSDQFSYPVVLGLLFGQDMQTLEDGWRIAYYDRRTVEGPNFNGLLMEVDGVEMILPQAVVLETLSDMQLDWNGSRYLLQDAPP